MEEYPTLTLPREYLDRETGLAFSRFRYYSPKTGAYIRQDPIRLEARLTNLYAYAHDVNAWVDPWGLELIPNKVAGNAREALAKKWLQKKYPNALILSELYIRDSSGVSVKDSFGSRRRLDFVVVEDGKVRGIFEVTSPTADKTLKYVKNNISEITEGLILRHLEEMECYTIFQRLILKDWILI